MQQYLFILGAAKTGTTALHAALSAHPQVVPHELKEPGYFCSFATRSWKGPLTDHYADFPATEDAYLAGFDLTQADRAQDTWCLDASTDYLWSEEAAHRLADWRQRFQSKAICVLRDPVERIISEYRHTLRMGLQSRSLMQSMEKEAERIDKHYHPLFYHRLRSDYPDQVARYHEIFGNDLIVLDHAELKSPDTLPRLLTFLDLDPDSVQALPQKNVNGATHNTIKRLIRRNRAVVNTVSWMAPKSLRKMIVERGEKPLPTPQPEEVDRLHEAVDDLVSRCHMSPMIDASRWSQPKSIGRAAE